LTKSRRVVTPAGFDGTKTPAGNGAYDNGWRFVVSEKAVLMRPARNPIFDSCIAGKNVEVEFERDLVQK